MRTVSVVVLALLAMGWVFVAGLLAMNFRAWWLAMRAKEGDRTPSGVPFLPGLAGVFMAYVTLGPGAKILQITVPWPWLWIILPVFLDMLGLGALLMSLVGIAPKNRGDGPGQRRVGQPP